MELFYKKTPVIALCSVVAAGLNYILNAIFIPRYGYIAAAFTTFFSYLILMILHYIAVRFYIKEAVYDSRFMFVSMALMTVAGLSIMALYGDSLKERLLRYAYAAIILAVFAFVNRNDIMMLVEYIKRYLKKKGFVK